MPMRDTKREQLAGLFVLIGLVLLAGLILQFGRFGDHLSGSYSLYIKFDNTEGVIKGSEVLFRGAKVGRVSHDPELFIGKDSSSVQMQLSIKDSIRIPEGSEFYISSAGFIGDKYIEISPPENVTGSFYQAGMSVEGEGSSGLDALQSDAERITSDLKEITEQAKVTLDKVNTALDSVTRSSNELEVSFGRINKGFLSEANSDKVAAVLANFEMTSNHVKVASQQLEPTIQDVRLIVVDAKEAINEAKATVAKIRDGSDGVIDKLPGAISSIKNAATKAEQTMTKAEQTMDALQKKDSLVGALTQDEETGENTKEFIKNIKRYGILRYRDDESPETNDPRNKFRGSRR